MHLYLQTSTWFKNMIKAILLSLVLLTILGAAPPPPPPVVMQTDSITIHGAERLPGLHKLRQILGKVSVTEHGFYEHSCSGTLVRIRNVSGQIQPGIATAKHCLSEHENEKPVLRKFYQKLRGGPGTSLTFTPMGSSTPFSITNPKILYSRLGQISYPNSPPERDGLIVVGIPGQTIDLNAPFLNQLQGNDNLYLWGRKTAPNILRRWQLEQGEGARVFARGSIPQSVQGMGEGDSGGPLLQFRVETTGTVAYLVGVIISGSGKRSPIVALY